MELRIIIKKIWKRTKPKILDEVIPPPAGEKKCHDFALCLKAALRLMIPIVLWSTFSDFVKSSFFYFLFLSHFIFGAFYRHGFIFECRWCTLNALKELN